MESLAQLAEKYKKIFFLHDDDILTVQKAGTLILDQRDAAFSEFYAWIEYQEDLQHIFTDRVLSEIEKTEKETWLDLLQTRVDEHSVGRQQAAAKLLRSFGVPFEAYMTALAALHEVIENVFVRKKIGTFELLRSFKKIAGIHICIAIDAYNEALNEALRAQNASILEMSTPITKLWDGISFLPLVGIIDSQRSEAIMTTMLQKIMETQAKVFVLDISGIAMMDTAVANYLIKITKASKLMGCLCILSGISPMVAETIVSLGVSEYEIYTVGSLQDALRRAFELTGVKIIKESR